MKSQQISALILARRKAGCSVRQAINDVLGKGAYEAIASDIYEALKAKAAAKAKSEAAAKALISKVSGV